MVFSSGSFLSLNSLSWGAVSSPPRSFQVAALDGRILLVGEARQNGTCGAAGCDGKTLYGDKVVLQYDEAAKDWARLPDLISPRLAYFSSVELNSSVCSFLPTQSTTTTTKTTTTTTILSTTVRFL